MRNIVMLLAILTLATHTITAQITLDSMNYPETEIGTDSTKITTAASSFPSLAPVAGGMWDLSGVADSSVVLFDYRVNTVSPFQFADSQLYVFFNFNYKGNIEYKLLNTGILQYQIEIHRSSNSLLSLTLDPSDSFVIPNQNMTFSTPQNHIAFPCTMNTAWGSDFYSDLHFQLTYLLGGDTLALVSGEPTLQKVTR